MHGNGNKCFVCTGEIQTKISESDNSSSEQNSILLCKILELPDLDGNKTKKFGGRNINYCRLCLNKILNICDMLEELERLEKKVLDEKYSIELLLKDKDKSQGENSSDQLRRKIVTDLRAASIESMLDKIRKKRVGQRRNAKGPRNIRIMKNVTIPKILSETIQPISEADNVVFVLQESQSELLHKDSFLPNPPSFVSNDQLEIQMEDTTVKEPHTASANMTETSLASVNDEFDIKYEVWSDSDMTIDSLQHQPQHLDFPQQNDLISQISTKLEVDELPDVTKFSDTQQTTTTITEDPPSHNNFICRTCGAGFVSYKQLRFHDRKHYYKDANGSSTVKTMRRKNGKSGHGSKNLMPSLRPKKCEECGKVLSCNRSWTDHVMSVLRHQFKINCTVCNYGCQKESHLLRHIQQVHLKKK